MADRGRQRGAELVRGGYRVIEGDGFTRKSKRLGQRALCLKFMLQNEKNRVSTLMRPTGR